MEKLEGGRFYAFLGKELRPHLKTEGNGRSYKKWIDTHSSTSFEESATQIEDLLDKLSVSLTGGVLEIIKKLHRRAMKLKFSFLFPYCPTGGTKMLDKQTQLFIFSDFDLTWTGLESCDMQS